MDIRASRTHSIESSVDGPAIVVIGHHIDTEQKLRAAVAQVFGCESLKFYSSATDALVEVLRTLPDIIVVDAGHRGVDGADAVDEANALDANDVRALADALAHDPRLAAIPTLLLSRRRGAGRLPGALIRRFDANLSWPCRRSELSAVLRLLVEVGASRRASAAPPVREPIQVDPSDVRLERLLAASPSVVYALEVTEVGVTTSWVSANVERLLGYTVEEALKPGWWASHLFLEDVPPVFGKFSTLKDKGSLRHEYRFQRKDGQTVWILDDMRLVAALADTNAQIVGVWTDITARKVIEIELAESKARLEDAERIAQLGSWDYDVAADRLHLSAETYRICGVDPEAFAHDLPSYFELLHPDVRADARVWLESLMAGEKPPPTEIRIGRPDGQERWLRVAGELTLSRGGTPIRAVGTVHDITVQRDVRLALEVGDERLRLALAAGRMGLYDIDFVTEHVTVNAEYERMLGFEPGSLPTSTARSADSLHPDDRSLATAIFDDYVAGRRPDYWAEFRMLTADGTWKWILSVGTVIDFGADGSPRRMVGTHTDISIIKENEAVIAFHAKRAEALLELPKGTDDGDEEAFLRRGLGLLESLTDSSVAFVKVLSRRGDALDICLDAQLTDPPPEKVTLWRDPTKIKTPLVANDPSLHPDVFVLEVAQHVGRILGVPVVEAGRVVMFVALGRKPSDYDDTDVETTRLLAEEMWRIIQRRRAERDRREAAHFNALLLEHLSIGIVACDAEGRLTLFNRVAREWHGLPADADLNREDWSSHYGLFEADGKTRMTPDGIPLVRAWRGETLRDLPMCVIATGQRRRLVMTSCVPVLDEQGRSAGAIAAMQDITAQHDAEAGLRLRVAALEAAANAIVITDRDGSIEWANPAFTQLTGFTLEESVGQNLRMVKSGQQDQAFYTTLWQTIMSGRVWQGEVVNRRKDGSTYPEALSITPVRELHGEVGHFIAIKRDLTEERALAARSLQSQKMESVGRLAGGVAHDFNNLLTVINGTLDVAIQDLPPGSPLLADLTEVRQASERAASLTQQLLAFSRQQIMRRELVSINDVLTTLSKLLGRIIGEEVVFETSLAPGLGSVITDRGQLEQVVMNLVVNARDAMPRGGTLSLSTAEVVVAPTDPGHVGRENAADRFESEVPWVSRFEAPDGSMQRVGAVPPGRYGRLSVRDSGIGMDGDTLARIFEPFFTTKVGGKGTGLGLPIVYGVVQQSEGYIIVTSAVGTGTVFDVFLPLAIEPEARVDTKRTQTAEPKALGKGTILIVDDEEQLRRIASRIIARAGYQVISAGGGKEALALLEAHGGDIDLVITDVVMPGMSGSELVAILKERYPLVEVVYTSGYTDDMVVRHGVSSDKVRFLSKPYSANVLMEMVRSVREA